MEGLIWVGVILGYRTYRHKVSEKLLHIHNKWAETKAGQRQSSQCKVFISQSVTRYDSSSLGQTSNKYWYPLPPVSLLQTNVHSPSCDNQKLSQMWIGALLKWRPENRQIRRKYHFCRGVELNVSLDMGSSVNSGNCYDGLQGYKICCDFPQCPWYVIISWAGS